MAYRRLLGYPPVTHMLGLLVTAREEDAADRAAGEIAGSLKDEEKVVLTGPGPAFIPRLNDVYRRVIYLRSAEEGILSGIPKKLEPMVNDLYETCGVEVTYDLDPLHII
jgi:primosomal protein N' (replication factor Y)